MGADQIVEFHPTETVNVPGRGTIYVGKCPLDLWRAVGCTVRIGDNIGTVAGIEFSLTTDPPLPRVGQSIGLILRNVAAL